MSKTNYYSVTFRQKPLFTKEQIEKITEKATLWQRLRLLIVRSKYQVTEDSVVRYKEMNNVYFIIKRRTWL